MAGDHTTLSRLCGQLAGWAKHPDTATVAVILGDLRRVVGRCADLDKELRAAAARIGALEAALTSSAETKAAYMGEFNFPFPAWGPGGESVAYTPNVPWVTIKQIMAAIREKADQVPGEGVEP